MSELNTNELTPEQQVIYNQGFQDGKIKAENRSVQLISNRHGQEWTRKNKDFLVLLRDGRED